MTGWRIRIGRVSIYVEPRDVWIGCYIALDAIYVCPLPLLVIRVARRAKHRGQLPAPARKSPATE